MMISHSKDCGIVSPNVGESFVVDACSNDFKIGEPVLLNEEVCTGLQQYFGFPQYFFEKGVIDNKADNCPKNFYTVNFLLLNVRANIEKKYIKKLVK